MHGETVKFKFSSSFDRVTVQSELHRPLLQHCTTTFREEFKILHEFFTYCRVAHTHRY